MKKAIKSVLKKLPINFTKNQIYDAQAKKIFKMVMDKDAVLVDIGCHKGEVLDWAVEFAPHAKHIGFEPIPEMAKALQEKYANHAIHNMALSDHKGTTQFHHVTTNPAYSGINKREYTKEENINLIEVEVNALDNVLDENQHVSLIKIDVEGGELNVLKGAKNTIQREKPVIVFEHGLGASEFYDSTPEKMWEVLHNELGMKISLMGSYLKQTASLSKESFCKQFYEKQNYYFVAHH